MENNEGLKYAMYNIESVIDRSTMMPLIFFLCILDFGFWILKNRGSLISWPKPETLLRGSFFE